MSQTYIDATSIDGTAIYKKLDTATLATAFDPNLPLKTNGISQMVAGKLIIGDVSDLQTTLDSKLGTITGSLDMANNKIVNLPDASNPGDACNFGFTESLMNSKNALKVSKAGDIMTGDLNMGIHKVTSSYLADTGDVLINKSYLDSRLAKKYDVDAWSESTVTGDSGEWNDICWSPKLGIFCAVDSSTLASIMTSHDGINWTRITPPNNNDLKAICWSPELELFCCVAAGGNANRGLTSPDGITWTERALSVAGASSWNAVCWSPELGVFCAVAIHNTNTTRCSISSDGITWTTGTTPELNYLTSICWSPAESLFVCVSSDGTSRVITSPDGINWTSITGAPVRYWVSVCWSPALNIFCAIGRHSSGIVMTSPDGINWVNRVASEPVQWEDVTWSPELAIFVAVTGTGTNRIMTSPDGITWTSRPTPRGASSDSSWYSIAWSPELSMFCCVSISGSTSVMTGSVINMAVGDLDVSGLLTVRDIDGKCSYTPVDDLDIVNKLYVDTEITNNAYIPPVRPGIKMLKMARVYLDTDVTLALGFDSTDFNIGFIENFNYIQIPVDGRYICCYDLSAKNATQIDRWIGVSTLAGGYIDPTTPGERRYGHTHVNNSSRSLSGSSILDLKVGDRVYLMIYHNTGASVPVAVDDLQNQCELSVHLLS